MNDFSFDLKGNGITDYTRDHIIIQEVNGWKTDYGFLPDMILIWEHFKEKYPELAADYLKTRRTYDMDASIVYKIKESYYTSKRTVKMRRL